MPSTAYRRWATAWAATLDEMDAAHAAVGGSGPGRRYATLQLNYAYALLLAAEFQGFCRDLHDECAGAVAAAVPVKLQEVVRAGLRSNRQLDRGNATPASLGADFGRFGVHFWPQLLAADPRVEAWQRRLTGLNDLRNAIAHSDFDPARLGGTITLGLADVRRFRQACRQLARASDRLLEAELADRVGRPPW